MTSLKKYQSISKKYSELKKDPGMFHFQSASNQRVGMVHTNDMFTEERERFYGRLTLAIPLMEKIISTKQALESIGPLHGYVNINVTCSECGEAFSETVNVYNDYDFMNAQCSQCQARHKNSEIARIVDNGKDLKPVYDCDGNLVEVTFQSQGEEYSIHVEGKNGDYKKMIVERE